MAKPLPMSIDSIYLGVNDNYDQEWWSKSNFKKIEKNILKCYV